MDVADVKTMTASVQVLIVDGSRRMSWKFFDQIPTSDRLLEFDLNEPGENDVVHLWGYVNGGPSAYGHDGPNRILVGTAWGELLRLSSDSLFWDAKKSAKFAEALCDLDQLYVGG